MVFSPFILASYICNSSLGDNSMTPLLPKFLSQDGSGKITQPSEILFRERQPLLPLSAESTALSSTAQQAAWALPD